MKLSVVPKIAIHLLKQTLTGKRGKVLAEGTRAPEFSVSDESGNIHQLQQYRGRKVILWFFPRAGTSG